MPETTENQSEKPLSVIVQAICGCNVKASERLVSKMDDSQKQRLQDAHAKKQGRTTLMAIRTELVDKKLKDDREAKKSAKPGPRDHKGPTVAKPTELPPPPPKDPGK